MRSSSLSTAAAVLSCSLIMIMSVSAEQSKPLYQVHHPEMDEPSKDYSCGRDWVSASIGCHKHCASGDDNECAELGVGWGCYIFTGVSFCVHMICLFVHLILNPFALLCVRIVFAMVR